jgi:predicted PhzF superfamily epimerase YddE/YHI9
VRSSQYFLRVFTDSDGNFGDAASVVLDEGQRIPDAKRQDIARKLNTAKPSL